jgi:hypothetical protein
MNMGNALADLGYIEPASQCYKKVLEIKPNYSLAFFNLFILSKNWVDAEALLEKSVSADRYHVEAEIMLGGLRSFYGDPSQYDNLSMDSAYKDHPYMRSFAWVFSLDETPSLYFERYSFFDAIIQLANHSRPFYEFGVWRGHAFRYLIRTFKQGFGFDTFSGLPEDWNEDFKAGSYSSEGDVPDIEGGLFTPGEFEDTLPIFFSEKRPMASLVNFDADLYSSTICALNFSKQVIDEETVLIFDEFIMNDNWEKDEFKALNEFCSVNSLRYKVLAVSFATKQVAVKLVLK